MYIACKHGWKDVVEHLRYLNHNLEIPCSEDYLFPLDVLCKYGHLDCLDLFTVDDDYLERHSGHHHPVYYAAMNHHFDIVISRNTRHSRKQP